MNNYSRNWGIRVKSSGCVRSYFSHYDHCQQRLERPRNFKSQSRKYSRETPRAVEAAQEDVMVITDHIVQQGESTFAHAKDATLIGLQGQAPSTSLVSTWNLFRLALVSACMLFAILISTVYSLNRAAGPPSTRGGWLETKQSPLHHILLRDQTLSDELKNTDCGLLERINDKATLELKTLVIAETVVPYQDREMLSKYVKQQLDASNVISDQQKTAVMTMVNMAPVEGSINKEDRGEGGSLRNSAVIALFKTYQNNIHFMLIGVRVEPRLGWRRISSKERNAWNDVLSRVLYNKVRGEAKTFLAYGTPTQLSNPFTAKPLQFDFRTSTEPFEYDASRLFANSFE